MKNWVIVLILGFAFISCNQDNDNKNSNTGNKNSDQPQKDIKITVDSDNFESFVRRKVESNLKIDASENYDLKIIEAYLDKDTLKDALILINREEFAIKKAKKEDKEKILKSFGYTATENYVYVFRGASQKVLTTPGIGSSIYHMLEAGLGELTSPGQNDFWVDYRFRNSMFRNYYTMRGDKLFLTLNCPIFDNIGEQEPDAYFIEHREVEARISKDIAIYEGGILNYDPSKIEDTYNFTPDSIVKKDDVFVYFIFDPSRNKFVTPMKPKDEEETL